MVRYRKLSESVHGGVWMAPDHLLVVTGPTFFLRYSERYDRFYFRDIEALIAVKNSKETGTTVLMLLVGIGFAMAVAASETTEIQLMWGALSLLFIPWAIVRIVNPAVLLRIQTRVVVTPGVPVRRRTMRRILARVGPLIEAAQQDLPGLEVLSGGRGGPATPAAAIRQS